jgi:hypothetical protein
MPSGSRPFRLIIIWPSPDLQYALVLDQSTSFDREIVEKVYRGFDELIF